MCLCESESVHSSFSLDREQTLQLSSCLYHFPYHPSFSCFAADCFEAMPVYCSSGIVCFFLCVENKAGFWRHCGYKVPLAAHSWRLFNRFNLHRLSFSLLLRCSLTHLVRLLCHQCVGNAVCATCVAYLCAIQHALTNQSDTFSV